MKMKLTADNVMKVAAECLFTHDEFPEGADVPADAVEVEGIICRYAFHPGRLEANRANVAGMLDQLDSAFKSDGGGGMSFLNACVDKDGNHWAEHPTMGMLFGLAIGLGLARYSLPREMWSVLPGGVPYITVDSKALQSVAA